MARRFSGDSPSAVSAEDYLELRHIDRTRSARRTTGMQLPASMRMKTARDDQPRSADSWIRSGRPRLESLHHRAGRAHHPTEHAADHLDGVHLTSSYHSSHRKPNEYDGHEAITTAIEPGHPTPANYYIRT